MLGRKIVNASRNVAIHGSTLYFVNTKQTLIKLDLEAVLKVSHDEKAKDLIKFVEVEHDVEDFVVTDAGIVFTITENGLIKKIDSGISRN